MSAEPEVPITGANNARRQYLAEHGISVPMDEMYAVSLLEFLLGDRLEQAKEYHEERVAPILDAAVGKLTRLQEQAQAQQARRTLLEGLHPQ